MQYAGGEKQRCDEMLRVVLEFSDRGRGAAGEVIVVAGVLHERRQSILSEIDRETLLTLRPEIGWL